MKKFLKAISLFLVVFLLSGCIKYNVDMKITKDKKMSMTFITAMASNMGAGDATTETDEEQVEQMKNDGWKVEDYKDDEFEGFKLTKEFADIDKLSSDKEVIFDLNEFGEEGKTPELFFQKKVEGGSTTYVGKFAFKIDTTTGADTEDEETPEVEGSTQEDIENQQAMEEMTKQMMKTMDLKFNIEVPNVVSSNATTVDGNKLSWDLTKMEEGKNIEFTFTLGDKAVVAESNSLPIVPLIIGGCSIALLIAVIVIFIITRKKKPSAPVSEMPPMPSVDMPTPSVEPVQEEPMVSVPEQPVDNTTDNNNLQ